MKAGEETGIPVGWDGELQCATSDSDSHDEGELESVLFDALTGIDPGWRDQLRVAE